MICHKKGMGGQVKKWDIETSKEQVEISINKETGRQVIK